MADAVVEEEVKRVRTAIRYADDQVGVHHVMDQRDVLVADALDVVLAVAVVQHRRAFDCLDGRDLGTVNGLEIIARAYGACRACARDKDREAGCPVSAAQIREYALERAPRTKLV